MAVLYAGDELHPIVSQLFVQILNKHIAFFGGQMTSVMIFDETVAKFNDIASDSHVVGLHLISDGSRL